MFYPGEGPQIKKMPEMKKTHKWKIQRVVIQQVTTWNGKLVIGSNYGEKRWNHKNEVELRTTDYLSKDPRGL